MAMTHRKIEMLAAARLKDPSIYVRSPRNMVPILGDCSPFIWSLCNFTSEKKCNERRRTKNWKDKNNPPISISLKMRLNDDDCALNEKGNEEIHKRQQFAQNTTCVDLKR